MITGILFPQSKSETIQIGQAAPSFFLKTLSGDDFFLSDHCVKPRQARKTNERRIVMMSFFATYCIPCEKEIPILEKIAADYKDKAVFVLVDSKEEPDKVRSFMDKKKIGLTVLLDRYGVAADKYGVSSLPSLFIIDEKGIVRYVQHGYHEGFDRELVKSLEQMLK